MLTLDLARKLRDAGLVWEPKQYDFLRLTVMDKGLTICLTDDYSVKAYQKEEPNFRKKHRLWLPSLSQLLAEIEGRGYEYRQEYKKAYGLNDYHCLISEKGKDKYFGWGADTHEEATGLALLHILGGGWMEVGSNGREILCRAPGI